MSLDDVSCLIPLYASEPYLPHVIANIESHLALDATILLSDQHGLDRSVDLLRDRYRSDPRVTTFSTTEGGNWVDNVNLLIENTRTRFFRIIPHDDSVAGGDTAYMAETLRAHDEGVLCHGHVRAETVAGRRLPDRDEPHLPLNPWGTPDEFSMAVFWQGLYSGAFKSLIRCRVRETGPLFIRPTLDLIHAERAWLYGLSLLGRFVFDDRAYMTKRYWEGSVSDTWNPDSSHTMSAADVMVTYVDDLVTDTKRRTALRFNCYLNAVGQATWLDGASHDRPSYDVTVPGSAENLGEGGRKQRRSMRERLALRFGQR